MNYQESSVESVLDSLPFWEKTLESAIKATDEIYLNIFENNNASQYSCLKSEEPLPFEELLLPFVKVAREKLIAQISAYGSLLSPAASNTLERNLLERLSDLSSQSIELQFSVFRHFKQSSLTELTKYNKDNHSKEQYQAFIKKMLRGDLALFLCKYSVLARLLAVATDLWVDATTEFIQHLAADWLDIQNIFQDNRQLGKVADLIPALSDPHNKGRSVLCVKFITGLKLIYKPKNLGIEQAYYQLLAWFNDHNTPLPFKLLKILNRSTHGWVEFVEHLPCQSQEEAKRYYQRAGMQLCIVHTLKGTDCHSGNIIACGEHPVLVDTETLFHHRISGEEKQEAETDVQSLVNQQLGNSVLRTGFLPQLHFQQNNVVYDPSGLGGVDEQDVFLRVKQWQNINTDSMSIKYEQKQIKLSANVTSLNGENLVPEDYVEDIIIGFRQMYLFLLDHRDEILALDGPLTAFAQQKVRFVFRHTSVYYSLLQKTCHPKFLRDHADYSIEFEILSKPLLMSAAKSLSWDLLQVEKQSLFQLDIPYFSAYTDSSALSLSSNQTIDNFFKEPSYDLVVSYLKQLNEADLEKEISIIRGSLSSRIMPKLHDLSCSVKYEVEFSSPNFLTQEDIVETVKAIATEIKQRAICADDGSTTWISLAYIPQAEKYQLQAMNYGLYDGSCGVALFLAAVEKVTGDSELRELALGTLQAVCQNLYQPEFSQRTVQKIGIGGGLGLGSIIYALVRISQFLNEEYLLKDAQHIASLITPELIAADKKFDIILGSAGTILGLLALYKASGDPIIIEKAISCGYHLLNHRVSSNLGYRAWPTLNGRLLTGISHGAAGIAYALLRLSATTQEQLFREAAEEAIAYEKSVFSGKLNNWPDLRIPGNSEHAFTFSNTWCNGAPGIGLARLGSLAILDTNDIREDIKVALDATLNYGLDNIDHLCCGIFGRIEFFLAASRQLSRIDLLETAQQQAAWVIARAKKAGSFSLMPNFNKNVYLPGFFQGTTGIGYELLRLAYPDLLPSVLLWE